LAGTGIVVGLTRHGGDEDGRRRDGLGRRSAGAGGRTARPVQAISAVVVGLVVAVTTRWAVAAAAATAAAAWLPALLRTTAGRRTERLEAIATWTELLRDTLSAAAGLGQAIVATADLAPRAVREPVVGLAARLSNGMAMDDALRAFAADLDEPSGDMVVCALLLAASAQSQRLTALLGALAQSCREEVAMHLRVEASRASARSSVRTVALFSLAFATVLFVVAHSYLAPFGTTTGQLVLLVVCACYAAGFWLMVRLVRPRAGHRLLLGGERT
jgi:Flp pilus assembly protein TadB